MSYMYLYKCENEKISAITYLLPLYYINEQFWNCIVNMCAIAYETKNGDGILLLMH